MPCPSWNRTSSSAALTGHTSFLLATAARITQTHHEKWDGTGYPFGLAGEEIPIEGRITAIADVYDALSSQRPYKAPFTHEECLEKLKAGRATHFDPQVLDAFITREDELRQVRVEYGDLS